MYVHEYLRACVLRFCRNACACMCAFDASTHCSSCFLCVASRESITTAKDTKCSDVSSRGSSQSLACKSKECNLPVATHMFSHQQKNSKIGAHVCHHRIVMCFHPVPAPRLRRLPRAHPTELKICKFQSFARQKFVSVFSADTLLGSFLQTRNALGQQRARLQSIADLDSRPVEKHSWATCRHACVK